MTYLFEVGTIHTTMRAMRFLTQKGVDPVSIINRHRSGDWAGMHEEDREDNMRAVAEGDARVFSSYVVHGERLYVVTEADRSSTTIMFADEY